MRRSPFDHLLRPWRSPRPPSRLSSGVHSVSRTADRACPITARHEWTSAFSKAHESGTDPSGLTFEASKDGLFNPEVDSLPATDDSTAWYTFLSQQKSLAQRKRLGGHAVLCNIWKALEARGLSLPARGEHFHAVWILLADALFFHAPDEVISLVRLSKVVQEDLATDFSFLVRHIMMHALRRRPAFAGDFLKEFEDDHIYSESAIQKIMTAAIESDMPEEAIVVFSRIYARQTRHDLHTTAMLMLEKRGATRQTKLAWHNLFTKHDQEGLGASAAHRRKLHPGSSTNPKRPPHDKSVDGKAMNEFPRSRVTFDETMGESRGIQERSIKDEFCARVFATAALPPQFAVIGLTLFGLQELGPLALRELAVRSQDIAEFKATIKHLQDRNVRITTCRFADALRLFALDGRQRFFDSIARSDIHHESFEEDGLLRQIVKQYIADDQLSEAHALMAVMSLEFEESADKVQAWNSLVIREIKAGHLQKVPKILYHMIAKGVRVRLETVSRIRKAFLLVRSTGRRQPTVRIKPPKADPEQNRHGLDKLVTLLLTMERSGVRIWDRDWREVLRRYGMQGRMSGLRLVCMNLLKIRGPKSEWDRLGSKSLGLESTPQESEGPHDANVASSSRTKGTTLEQVKNPTEPSSIMQKGPSVKALFCATMQRAIISWGFQSLYTDKNLPRALRHDHRPQDHPDAAWLSGLVLLRELQTLGLTLHVDSIRKELLDRLGMLYTPGRSARLVNRRAKCDNTLRLADRVALIEKAFAGPDSAPGSLLRTGCDPTAWNEDERLFRLLFVDSGWLRRHQGLVGSEASVHTRWADAQRALLGISASTKRSRDGEANGGHGPG